MTEPTIEETIAAAAEAFRNWGRWGPEDQIGTLNFITPEKRARAAELVRTGRSFSLALPLGGGGPQKTSVLGDRFDPVLTMLMSGADAVAGTQGFPHGLGVADDLIAMPLSAGTQWDGLGHIFDRGRMWNGRSASLVTARGAQLNGIEKLARHVVTRGVLLDIARWKGVRMLEPGYAITELDLDGCAEAQGVEIGTGDAVIVRTGQLEQRLSDGWGDYAGGDAPGLAFSTAGWLHIKEIAAIAADTWGAEVRPCEFEGSVQPLHQVMIPNMGLLVGEIFSLGELADDCAEDGVYEFLLAAGPLPIRGAVSSPVNPLALK